MDFCGIKEIEPGAFSQLSNLRQLDLRNNEISSLPDNVFSELTRYDIIIFVIYLHKHTLCIFYSCFEYSLHKRLPTTFIFAIYADLSLFFILIRKQNLHLGSSIHLENQNMGTCFTGYCVQGFLPCLSCWISH